MKRVFIILLSVFICTSYAQKYPLAPEHSSGPHDKNMNQKEHNPFENVPKKEHPGYEGT